jgi:hypothetical protein
MLEHPRIRHYRSLRYPLRKSAGTEKESGDNVTGADDQQETALRGILRDCTPSTRRNE